MSITKKDVLKIADLAKLNLSNDEIEKFTKNLSDIVGFADSLNSIDISNVKPTAGILPLTNVFRKDEVEESMQKDKILKNSKYSKYGCFYVDNKVIG